MNNDKEISAKKAYIEYTKLQQLRKDVETLKFAASAINLSIQRYNEILAISKEVLSQDTELAKSIEGLKPIERLTKAIGPSSVKIKEIIIESGVLLSALASFISWYLPEKKQKTIGFRE